MAQTSEPEAVETAVGEQAAELFVPGAADRVWYVFHTRPRCEKKAAQICLDLNIRHYLALCRNTHRKKGRTYSFEVPFFAGYMFGCCDRGERLTILQSGYLVRTIEVTDQQRLLDELYNIYIASHQVQDLALYPQLKHGRWVRMLKGPLKGVEGRISKRKEGLRLVLNVSILGTAVAAEVDMEDVEVV